MRPDWWNLPGPQRFVERLANELRSGSSIVLLAPLEMPQGLRGALDHDLGSDVFHWRFLNLLELDGEARPPARLLLERFSRPKPGAFLDEFAVAVSQDLWRCIFWIEGFDMARWKMWIPFVEKLDQIIRNQDVLQRPLFFLLLEGLPKESFPLETVTFKKERWNATVQPLDMQLFLAGLVESRALCTLSRSLIRTIAAELSGSDPDLGLVLSKQNLETLVEPKEILSRFGRARNWDRLSEPTWESGTVDSIEGHDFVHSSFLSLHGDGEGEIDRRIWKAQVRVLFPWVEQHRIRLVQNYSSHLKLPYETKFGEIIDNPLDLEIPYLEWQLRRAPIGRTTKNLLWTLKEIRHHLAHIEAVPEHLLSKVISISGS